MASGREIRHRGRHGFCIRRSPENQSNVSTVYIGDVLESSVVELPPTISEVILGPIIPNASIARIGVKTEKILNPAIITKVVRPPIVIQIPLEGRQSIEIRIGKLSIVLTDRDPESRVKLAHCVTIWQCSPTDYFVIYQVIIRSRINLEIIVERGCGCTGTGINHDHSRRSVLDLLISDGIDNRLIVTVDNIDACYNFDRSYFHTIV